MAYSEGATERSVPTSRNVGSVENAQRLYTRLVEVMDSLNTLDRVIQGGPRDDSPQAKMAAVLSEGIHVTIERCNEIALEIRDRIADTTSKF